jgi:hypothetical protein
MVVDVVPLGLWLLLCVVVVRGVTQHGYYMLEYTGTGQWTRDVRKVKPSHEAGCQCVSVRHW